MKIAISTDKGFVSAHFGRCPTYTLVDIEDGQICKREEISNPGHQPGFLPRYLGDMGVKAIIAGGMGPRAQALFAENDIQTIIGVQGPVEEVVERYLRQELEAGQDLCDHGHPHEGACHHEHSVEEGSVVEVFEGRLCVTAKEESLDAELDPNFGRAPYLVITDPKTMEFEVLENPNAQAALGAGVQTAQFIATRSVSAVLTGKVGPNAERVLKSAGIEIILSSGRTVREAISNLKRS